MTFKLSPPSLNLSSILAIPLRLTNFIDEHLWWSLLIGMLILSYFVQIPYLHDFVRWFVGGIVDFIGISYKK